MSIGGKSLHKEDYLKLAILAAGTATGFGMAGMGPMAGMFGASAAGAAGAGAAGAAGAGIGGGTAASLFGPTAAQAATLATYAPTAAAGAGTAGSIMGGGTAASMFAPAAEHAFATSLLPGASSGPGLLGGANWAKGFDTMQKISKLQELAGGGQQREKPEPAQRPPVQPMPISDAVRYWQQIYGGLS